VPEYVVESGASARARARRRRSLITIAVLLLALFFAFWFALSYYRNATNEPKAATPTATCAPADPKAITPANTRINVYNTTNRAGLAASVGKQLTARGFVVVKVANDPASRTLKAPLQIHYGPAGKPYAELLARQTGKGTVLVTDKRSSSIIDVVLGPTYAALGPAPKAPLPPCPKTATG
jgi:hypothetical protein